jgi:hypothetical protein
MRGNPVLRVSSTAAPDSSGHVARQAYGERLSAAIADGQRNRPELRLNRSPSYARQPIVAQNSDSWRDQLLTEIEDLVAELRGKVARYSLFRSGPSFNDASHPDNRAAAEWMHEALEDIAATALGIELASEVRISRMRSAAEQDLYSETNQEPKSGTAG